MSPRIIRLQQINQQLDTICFRDPYDDEDDDSHLGRYALGGITAGAGGYGAFKLNKAIRNRQGGMNIMRPAGASPTTYAGAATDLAADTLRRGANLASQGAGAVKDATISGLKNAATKIGTGGKSAWQAILKKLGLKAATALSSRHESLIELNAKLDEVIEFVTPDERRKGQTPENNMRRGIGIGLLGGSWPGAIAGGQDAAKFRREGVVYRKRDVFGNALGGAVAGLGASAGGQLALLTKAGRRLTGKVGSLTTGIGSGLVGAGAAYGTQRLLAGHTLKKRQATYAS
jgi:hypothetical protein